MRPTVHRAVYFILLIVLVGAQSVSNYMMSCIEVLLFANWFFEWDMKRKFSGLFRLGKQHGHSLSLLAAFLILMAVHFIWMIGSENLSYALDDIFRKLPLLAIPLVVLTSRPLNRKQLSFLFNVFIATVFVATIIGLVRYLSIPDLPYRKIVPFISNIRFSLNVCFAIVLLVAFFVHARHFLSRASIILLIVWFLFFLLIIRSYTAFFVLLVLLFLMPCLFWRRIVGTKSRLLVFAVQLIVIVTLTAVSVTMFRDYYRPVPLACQPLQPLTPSGNAYSHACDGLVENGNYINNYVCESELRQQWHRRSSLCIDSLTPNGYAVMPTLVRYLNGMGLAKDSAGVSALTDSDIRAIEQGIANPVYVNGGPIRKMFYVTLFEVESYRRTGAVKGFSLIERLLLWKNAWCVFLDNPLFGVGTGDVVDVCHSRLQQIHSPLADTNKHAHSQYLSFLVAFGLVGTLLIIVAFVIAIRRGRLMRLPLFAAMIIIVLVSFIAEDTLETLAGCVFSVLFTTIMANSDPAYEIKSTDIHSS